MPHFEYTALDREGREIRDTASARDRDELTSLLQRKRQILLTHKVIRGRQLNRQHLEQLITDLAELTSSGIVLDSALHAIGEDHQNPKVRLLAENLRGELKGGNSLSASLLEIGPNLTLEAALIAAGENSGKLPEILGHISHSFEQRRKLRQELIGKITYPLILVAVSILSLIGLAVFVIPVFQELYADETSQLPGLTQLVFAGSDLVTAYGGIALAVLAGLLLLYALAVRFVRGVSARVDEIKFGLPGIGTLIRQRETARFCRLLALQLGSGIPLLTALKNTLPALDNRAIRRRLAEAESDIRQGSALSAAIGEGTGLTAGALRYLGVGEKTGELGRMAEKAADLTEKNLSARLNLLVSLIEPAIILGMGLTIGVIVSAMLLAVFSMSDIMA